MKWIVIGAGKSGIGARNLLEHHKQDVLLFDENKSKLNFELQSFTIDDSNHPIFSEKNLTLVISPGVSLEHPLLKRARERNHRIVSEIDLALSYYKGHVLGVTGTNGKSTTVMMTGCLLKQLHIDFALGGNIGIAASSLMMEAPHEYLLLELSSYQIEASELLKPKVAVLTGIAPDHLSRHKSLKGYVSAKWRLFDNQGPEDLAVIEECVYKQAIEEFQLPKPKAKTIVMREKDLSSLDSFFSFRWKHDRINAFFALQIASFLSGKPIEHIAPLLKSYKGLPFRCEVIGKIDSWSIINDSKGTNMDSTLHALTNTSGKITLFLGGLGKGESFLDVLKYKENIERIIAFGKSGTQIHDELSPHFPTQLFFTLKDAMKHTYEILVKARGDILFSPACASQDEFTDFEDRGIFFTQCVHSSLKKIKGGLAYEPILNAKTS